MWNAFPGDKYHVIGNHDADHTSKEAYMKYAGMESPYYSFDKGDFHFIVLDPNTHDEGAANMWLMALIFIKTSSNG